MKHLLTKARKEHILLMYPDFEKRFGPIKKLSMGIRNVDDLKKKMY